MPTEYDITRAFKRIERELQASMIRNLKRHRAEEIEEGFDWEMWQHIQLKELERYRKANEDKFTEDFSEIDRKTEELFRKTAVGAQKRQTEYLEEKTGKSVEGAFFGVNDGKLNALITATKADFNKAEHAALRKANDDYRRVIFDAQVYASTGATYEQAVDMATKDFLRAGINSVVYKNGARHTVSSYAAMALRTGNKRAYLMGYGNANEKYGIHTVRVNKRQNACPLCVKWLGRVLVDDVYGGGTGAEASALNVPTLSQAIAQGFLHPNCKDVYSIYIEGVSQPADPWTKAEMEEIAESYNTETELRHAEDMEDTYRRMSELSLDPENQKIYGERAERWKSRVSRLKAEEYKKRKRPPVPDVIDDLDEITDTTEAAVTSDNTQQQVEEGIVTPERPVTTDDYTEKEKQAIEWYVSGDGMWVNNFLRGRGEITSITPSERDLIDALTAAADRPLDSDIKTLYRSVDAEAVFGDLTGLEREQIVEALIYGDDTAKASVGKIISSAENKTIADKGFMSTTLDKDLAGYFDGYTGAESSVVLELDVSKANIKGADLTPWDVVDDPQREILLQRGTSYRITDIGVDMTEDGTKFIKVKAEVIDQAESTAQDVVEETVKEAAQAPEHEIVQGRDLLGTFKRRHDEFEFAINDVVNAQGFDGLPQVVPADKFDEAVKESNFVAQRSYSAPTAEQLEVYTDQLYNGDWYINCSTGGAQYGQGMYTAADYDGIITEGMRNEMEHYNSINSAYNADGSKVTMFQLETDMQESLFMKRTGRKPQVGSRSDEKLFMEIRTEVRDYLLRDGTTWESCIKDFDLPYLKGHHKIETLTLTPDARILTIPRGQKAYEYVVNKVVDDYVMDNLTSPEAKALWEEFTTLTDEIDNHRQFEGMQELLDKRDALRNQNPELWEEINKLRSEGYGLVEGIDDPGVLAALRGYDAINAVGHGESGSYTVILNRTKVIFKE